MTPAGTVRLSGYTDARAGTIRLSGTVHAGTIALSGAAHDHYVAPPPPPPPSVIRVTQEYPRTDLGVEVETRDSGFNRWAADERDPSNVPSGLTFSNSAPGGHEALGATLARNPKYGYPDLEVLSTIRARGAGGEVAWEGFLQAEPSVSGDQMAITPSAVGYQQVLNDRENCSVNFIDRDLGQWGDVPSERKILEERGTDAADGVFTYDNSSASPLSGAVPTLSFEVDAPAQAYPGTVGAPITLRESWYDAGLLQSIGEVRMDWNAPAYVDVVVNGVPVRVPYFTSISLAPGGPITVNPGDTTLAVTTVGMEGWVVEGDGIQPGTTITACGATTSISLPIVTSGIPWASSPIAWQTSPWVFGMYLASVAEGPYSGGGVTPAIPGSGSGRVVNPDGSSGWNKALIQLFYQRLSDAYKGRVDITNLRVIGNHKMPISAPAGSPAPSLQEGILASDALLYIIRNFTTLHADNSTIEPSTFVIPQLRFDLAKPGDMVSGCTGFGLPYPDWFVYDNGLVGPTFYCHRRGTNNRRWRARSGPSSLSQVGPDVSTMVNQVAVSYSDVTGVAKLALPNPDDRQHPLIDTDPQSPLNLRNKTKLVVLQMGITSVEQIARVVGQTFLNEAQTLSRAGQAQHHAVIEDADTGVLFPAYVIRSGDTIAYVDAADPSPRRVAHMDYDGSSRTATVSLDGPPDELTGLLARLGVSISSLSLG